MTDGSASSFGKKILGLFVETDETSPDSSTQTEPQAKVSVAKSPATSDSSVDQEMLATLQNKINSRTSPYITLIEAADRLVSVIPDEATRFKAAFAMVSGDGNRSVSSITKAIDVHMSDLEGERIRFKKASDEQTMSKSASLREQAKNLAAQNVLSSGQVERLLADIAKLQDSIVKNTAMNNDLTLQADNSEAEIKAVSAKFDRTVDYLKNDLAEKKLSLSNLLS